MRTKQGPSKNKFLQQSFHVRQLVYTTSCVMPYLIISAVICFVIGAPMYYYSAQIQSFHYIYSDPTRTNTCPDVGDLPCLVRFSLTERMAGPVFLYYSLTNFYQNHRRYVASRSDAMDRGDFGSQTLPLVGSPDQSSSTCPGFDTYTVNGKTIEYYPCGLIAMSIFNDTFSLISEATRSELSWRSDGITWPISDSRRFQSKSEDWLRTNCYRLGGLDENNIDFNFSGFPESLRGFTGTNNENQSRYNCWHSVTSPELQVLLI